MADGPPRILFSVPGKRGLGHIMRGLNIAREVRALSPEAECVFASRGLAVPTVVGEEFPAVVVPSDDERPPAVVAAQRVRPHVVVHDTALPDDVRVGDAAPVYVMRKSLPERQQAVLASPALRDLRLVLVPHTREEFGAALPADVADRCVFVGPVVRRPTPAGQQRARARYAAAGACLLTSTVGGGGFRDTADAFFATVERVHATLSRRLPALRHVVLRGPNYTGELPHLPGATVVDFDPDLVDLLAASDLVVAEGGYNTVLEVRVAQVPAVFLPGARNWDDQEGRVRDLEHRGLARVAVGGDAATRAAVVLDAVQDPAWLAGVRRRYADDVVDTGNRRAAEALLGLVPT